ncbi:MAG: EamA family transporter [Acidobacteria bacterium]|nr:MAG: EamA family transporter [Acidobacteriota bacterium]
MRPRVFGIARPSLARDEIVCLNAGMASSPTRFALSLPVLASIAAALLFGASTPLAKALLSSLGPFTLAGLLYLDGAVGALPFAFRGGSAELRRDPRQRRLLGFAVIFGGGVAPVLLLLGLRTSPAASVSLWLNTEVVATALLAWTLFRENLDRRTILAGGLVLAGGIILAAPEGAAGWKAGAHVAGACVCWGIDNNLTALVSGFTPAQTTLAKGLIAGTVNLVLGLSLGQHLPGAARVGGALGVGAISYGCSIMLYIFGAQHLGATRSQLLFATAPFLGVILAWTLFQERIQPAQLAAIPCIVAGLYFMLTARHEHEHAHEAMAHTHSHRHDDGHHTHVHPGLPSWVRHTHAHEHEPLTHSHPHVPDLHHRHQH